MQHIHTDLAMEAHDYLINSSRLLGKEVHGIRTEKVEQPKSHTQITRVFVESKNGAKALGKPMGRYITLENPILGEKEEHAHQKIALELCQELKSLIPNFSKEQSILVVGLGNRNVTADSLGPLVIDKLNINRHIVTEYSKAAYTNNKLHIISGFVPGVMAQTGMETADIIKGVVQQTSPDLLLVIDALCAANTKRLHTTIQLSDTGIAPGSGVGNHRNGLTKQTLGIPVIAIGIPTVVNAATLVVNALESTEDSSFLSLRRINNLQNNLYSLRNMYVTEKNINEMVDRLSFVLSAALNHAFSE